MISYKNAVKKILTYSKPRIISISISKSLNHIVAENIFCKRDNPNFNNSLLDGFAVKSSDVKKNKTLFILGKISAGEKRRIKYKKNNCYQIATGCPIYAPYDSMIPYEQVFFKNNNIIQCKTLVKKFQNVRKKGADYKKNSLLLKKGSKIKASNLLAIKTLGISKVKVFSTTNGNVVLFTC